MSLILNIDTAIEISSICLAQDELPISVKINPSKKDSAAWLHSSIEELLREQNLGPGNLDAIAVSGGPGSYTGLRVGMSTAKGLCYVLNKPLIILNTLELMAFAAPKIHGSLICPMIDARRMEVFTAIFDRDLNCILPPTNLILTEGSFVDYLKTQTILFFGNGTIKFQAITKHSNALFANIEITATSMTPLSFKKFQSGQFSELAYSTPFYGKEFHSIAH